MTEIALVVAKEFAEDRIFNEKMRDKANNRFILLREKLRDKGISIRTRDKCCSTQNELTIFVDGSASSTGEREELAEKNILIISESPIICPRNQSLEFRRRFTRVLTWESSCREKNTYWLGCGCSFVQDIEDNDNYTGKRSKKICLIAGNKYSTRALELYSSRVRAIKYFEKSPIELDVYGPGWDKRNFRGLLRPLNKIRFARTFGHSAPKSYRGTIENKFSILREYEFSLAYENAYTENGYITEKIFDSMFSGCIPIYKGAKNISDYIPDDCYINANNISSIEEIAKIATDLSDDEKYKMKAAMHKYSKAIKKTSYYDNTWAEEVVKHCIEVMGN